MSDAIDRTQPEIVESFVSAMRSLMADIARRRPGDPIIDRARKRLNMAADLMPVDVLMIAGPTLYEHRDDIYAEDNAKWQRFFTTPDVFRNDLEQAEDVTKRDIAEYMIPKVQEIASSMTTAEQLEYIEIVRSLLDDYIDWRILCGGA